MFPRDYDSRVDPLPPLSQRLTGYMMGVGVFGFLLWLFLVSL